MFTIHAGRTRTYCDGLSRRSFLKLGVAGMASVNLADVLRARAESAALGNTAKNTSVILIWLDGGPEPPGHVRHEAGSPGRISRHLAADQDERSGLRDHRAVSAAGQVRRQVLDRPLAAPQRRRPFRRRALHAHRPPRRQRGRSNRQISIHRLDRRRACGPRDAGMPAYAAFLMPPASVSAPAISAQTTSAASTIRSRPTAIRTIAEFQGPEHSASADLTIDRLERPPRPAATLRSHAAGERSWRHDGRDGPVSTAGVRPCLRQRRPQGVRYQLGDPRNFASNTAATTGGKARCWPGGLSKPAARSSPLHFGGWDHHWDLQGGMEDYLPMVDATVSALLTDLTDRGLYDRVLVVLCGEFSRTPRMNNGGNGGPPMSMGTPGPRSLGQLDVLPAGRRRRERGPHRRLDEPPRRSAQRTARSRPQTSMPRSTPAWASTRA